MYSAALQAVPYMTSGGDPERVQSKTSHPDSTEPILTD